MKQSQNKDAPVSNPLLWKSFFHPSDRSQFSKTMCFDVKGRKIDVIFKPLMPQHSERSIYGEEWIRCLFFLEQDCLKKDKQSNTLYWIKNSHYQKIHPFQSAMQIPESVNRVGIKNYHDLQQSFQNYITKDWNFSKNNFRHLKKWIQCDSQKRTFCHQMWNPPNTHLHREFRMRRITSSAKINKTNHLQHKNTNQHELSKKFNFHIKHSETTLSCTNKKTNLQSLVNTKLFWEESRRKKYPENILPVLEWVSTCSRCRTSCSYLTTDSHTKKRVTRVVITEQLCIGRRTAYMKRNEAQCRFKRAGIYQKILIFSLSEIKWQVFSFLKRIVSLSISHMFSIFNFFCSTFFPYPEKKSEIQIVQ